MPHLGQLRLAICVDVLIRWLEASGFGVTYCRNATDLDCALLAAASAEKIPPWILAERAQRHYTEGCAALGCRPPDADPRMAEQVSEMMACYGPEFDIHAGKAGRNCRENGRYCLHIGQVRAVGPAREQASRARPVEVRYLLAQEHYGETIECCSAILEEAGAAYQRIERFVIQAYRLSTPGGTSPLAFRRQYPSRSDPQTLDGGKAPAGIRSMIPISFAAVMDDDLDVAAALRAVHATVHDGNYAIRSGDRDAVAASLAQVRAMLAVLGLDPLDPHWLASDSSGRLLGVIDGLVDLALRQREAAQARDDYASADSIRDTLETVGVEVEDTLDGPRWELKR
jgi:cysteinyl-tRNA synthetase